MQGIAKIPQTAAYAVHPRIEFAVAETLVSHRNLSIKVNILPDSNVVIASALPYIPAQEDFLWGWHITFSERLPILRSLGLRASTEPGDYFIWDPTDHKSIDHFLSQLAAMTVFRNPFWSSLVELLAEAS